ncbi:MAG: hypothetical protein EBQ89_03245 [Alphaproteobacteria bacterium]|nr:hypothetical protein [Alphaproteobacteria bacterium]
MADVLLKPVITSITQGREHLFVTLFFQNKPQGNYQKFVQLFRSLVGRLGPGRAQFVKCSPSAIELLDFVGKAVTVRKFPRDTEQFEKGEIILGKAMSPIQYTAVVRPIS